MEEDIKLAIFVGPDLIARGTLEEVVESVRPIASGALADLRIFIEGTGRAVDFDWRGTTGEVVARARAQLTSKSSGRPRLGVESREVTLLPRHWSWLDRQGRSASAAIRRLVDEQISQAGKEVPNIDPLYRQMSVLAGNLPHFEDAARYLYRFEWEKVRAIFASWPGDLGTYFTGRLRELAGTSD
jgi:uncharacterized protein